VNWQALSKNGELAFVSSKSSIENPTFRKGTHH
jgi:hypothetical protein